jgi:hypothetical protein
MQKTEDNKILTPVNASIKVSGNLLEFATPLLQ